MRIYREFFDNTFIHRVAVYTLTGPNNNYTFQEHLKLSRSTTSNSYVNATIHGIKFLQQHHHELLDYHKFYNKNASALANVMNLAYIQCHYEKELSTLDSKKYTYALSDILELHREADWRFRCSKLVSAYWSSVDLQLLQIEE